MSAGTQFTIGSEVLCTDGACGELRRVVVNPVARELTHLVVEPRLPDGNGRLVPIDLVDSSGEEIRLRCSLSEFRALEKAEETHFLPGARGQWGYDQGQMLSLPYFGAGGMGIGLGTMGVGAGGLGMGGMGLGGLGMLGVGAGPQTTTEDRVPEGEVEVRRGQSVQASDGSIGRVHGFVVDENHRVTHILLDEGHLWGKKTVAIPISAVKDISDGVVLSLTKDEVGELPPVDLADPS